MERQDTSYLNIMKGICIVLVVFGHAIIPNIRENNPILLGVWNFLYLFHMPVFFFVSGYLFEFNKYKYTDNRKFIIRKFQLLMIPYFVYSFISYCGINICTQISKLNSILTHAGYYYTDIKNMIIQILTCEQHMDKHIWFIYALFIIFCINIFLKKKSTLKTGLAMIVIYILFTVLYTKIFIPDLFMKVVLNLVYFYFGRLFIKIKDIKLSRYLNFMFCVIFLVLAFFQSTNPIDLNNILSCFRVLFFGFSGISFTMIIAKEIEKIQKIKPIFEFLNTYSYDIYLIHQPFIVSGVSGILWRFTSLSEYIIVFFVLLIGILIPITISKYIIRKNRILLMLLLGNRI